MSRCLFCGQDAGLLRSVHKECKQVHDDGVTHIVERAAQAAVTQSDLPALQAALDKTASAAYIDDESLRHLLATAWEHAVLQALDDNSLSEAEKYALGAFSQHFSLAADALDKDGAHTKIVKAAVLRDIREGKLRQRVEINGTLPFNFQEGETLVWPFGNVPYYEPRTRTTYSGGYSGASLRIAKRGHYRTGGFRGNPIVTTQSVLVDIGALAITDKHIYFAGKVKSFRLRYDKIVSCMPYREGIAIQRDASTAKPQVFITGDGWFTYNLVTHLAHSSVA